MLDGAGAMGKFDFEVADLFLFGCPLGLVLALRKTVIPSLDGESPCRGREGSMSWAEDLSEPLSQGQGHISGPFLHQPPFCTPCLTKGPWLSFVPSSTQLSLQPHFPTHCFISSPRHVWELRSRDGKGCPRIR